MAGLTITGARTLAYEQPSAHHIIEVNAEGPRGGAYEFTVTFSRGGKAQHGYRFSPRPEANLPTADDIPPEVREAAQRAWWEAHPA